MTKRTSPSRLVRGYFVVLTDFQPLPFLSNPHVQTVLGNYLTGPRLRVPTRERHVLLPDGDRLVLHDAIPAGWQPGERIAILVHGLGGSHRSGHLQRTGRHLLKLGIRVVRVDLRGCGRGAGLARRPYHGGCSDDIRAAVMTLAKDAPPSPLVLVGFSLGGNIVLKLAGEAAVEPVPGLERVVAVAPPIDLGACAALLGQPRNRMYERYFLHDLLEQARRRQWFFPSEPPLNFPSRMTMRKFDDLYTAPRCGYEDALDYYLRASSLPLLNQIRVPTLVLTARDDPFVAVEPFETLDENPHVEVRIMGRGGHLGFLGWDGVGGIRWAERCVIHWLQQSR